MNTNRRIALNTIYIYGGVVLCTLLSLVTVPILLKNLGVNDYGLYNLIAGVIAMLSFFKNSMIVTVQRFLNVAYGENDIIKVRTIFTISLYLYIIVALIIGLLIELFGPFITNGYLNIEPGRLDAAIKLFHILVVSTIITTIGVPFDALFNVYEEMWLFSFFNTIDYLLRFLFAIGIGYVYTNDKLLVYAIGITSVSLFLFILKYFICKRRYNDIILIKITLQDLSIVKRILSFIGWNLYSTIAKIFSTQGYAVVLNLFMGTAINAAYGIANQINSALNQFTSSVEKAFNPQIMKSEGMNEPERMIKLSLLSTKYCSLLYSFIAIPLFVAMPIVLDLWLKTTPQYTLTFSRIVLLASMVSMLTVGLAPMLYAKGEIRNYLLSMGTLLITVVFAAYGCLKSGLSVYIAISLFIILELILFFVRLYFCKRIASMSLRDYFMVVLLPFIKTICVPTIVVFVLPGDSILNVIINSMCFIVLFLVFVYMFGFNSGERFVVRSNLSKLYKKVIK